MQPTLYTGDLAIVHSQGSYGVGNVVAFRVRNDRGDVGNVVHRIVGGSAEDGFVTQGDNKNGPDPWRPKPDEILGEVWFYVPGGGRAFAFLRQPQVLSAVVGSLAMLSLAGGAEVKRRRRRGDRMTSKNARRARNWLGAPAWAVAALSTLGLLALGFGAGAILSFRQPTHASRVVERTHYEHTAVFDYTVQTERSVLYPEGVVGPILPASADPAVQTAPPPIYAKLARALDLGFTYALKAPLPPDVSGDLSAALEVKAADGWTKTLELLPPAPFAGPATSSRVTVDFAEVFSLIDAIERETGVKAPSYTISVIPTVRVTGQVGAEPVDESYAPAFGVKLDRTRITPDAELVRTQARKTGEAVSQEQAIALLGLSSPVSAARLASSIGTSLSLAGLVTLASLVLLRLRLDEPARISARYGSLLVGVARADLNHNSRLVEVASMRDLVRLAQQDGQVVFHQEVAPGSHIYYVQRGDLVFAYTASGSAGEA